jgi:hypothetical protein
MRKAKRVVLVLLPVSLGWLAAGCVAGDDPAVVETATEALSGNPNPGIAPVGSRPFGDSYSDWSAKLWKWGLEYPADGHHPFSDPVFDFSARQSGQVWFWGAPPGPLTRTVSIPSGKAILLSLLDAECSSLETPPFFGATAADQLACATQFVDYVDPASLQAEIDGRTVKEIVKYRTASPQFHFTAPSPWLNGPSGGDGTSVADGYYLMVLPLPSGEHCIHYVGTFHIPAGVLGDDPADVSWDVTIQLTVTGH